MRDLARRAVRGSISVAAASYSGFLLTFISTAVVSRLVAPSDFGAYALAQSYSQILLASGAFGFTQAVVQSPGRDLRFADTAVIMTVVVRLLLACIAVPAALVLSRLHGVPVALAFFQLSLLQVADAIRIGLTITLERDLDYARIARVSVIANVVSTIVSIAAAFEGLGIHALVFRDASLTVVLLLGAWVIARRSRLSLGASFDQSAAREIWEFGRSVYLVRALDQVCSRIDRVLLGNILSLNSLGFYHQAKYVASLPANALAPGNFQVALTTYSKLKADPSRLSRAFSTVQYFVIKLVPPFAIASAIWPRELLLFVCGPRWAGAAAPLRVFALFALTFAVSEGYRSLFGALEQWAILRWSAMLQVSAMILTIPLLARAYGVVGAALAALFASGVGLVFLHQRSRRYVVRLAGKGALRGAAAILCTLTGAIVCKWVVVVSTPRQSLALGIGVSVVLYAAMVWLWERKEVWSRLRSVVASAVSRA